MRERAMPAHQLRHWQHQLEQVPALLHSARHALNNLPERQPPLVIRSGNTGLRVVGLLLVLLGASQLGGDPGVWTEAEPTSWLLLALGGWLILRRA